MARTAGFIAGCFTRGFTLCNCVPPRFAGHLMHGLLYRHVKPHFFSFGPSLQRSYYDRC
ncbi:hypothetical protein BV352_05725 [Pseudomonas syringae pv. actinidiae]|uniref:Site-specific DNA-cytosine methylase n=1 Tax=Pseudomonas syringae pv. actinidiae TaxID=103796 RepID=A0AAN4Q4J7_PSESF|nr:hypothetical protein BV352_05725 [Pseudomonas syringae pv. actinidiae]OSR79111.1 hypothetical protein BV329_05675 [Pseudomonas syringae pv. actinidiae]GBH17096.1 Site-specific DNA-cytosine methylase [Pseudomonas syringae pv. actinidiae]